MSSLHREIVMKRTFEGFLVADMDATEKMEKKKAMEVAWKTTTTIGGLQKLFGELAAESLPEVSSHHNMSQACISQVY